MKSPSVRLWLLVSVIVVAPLSLTAQQRVAVEKIATTSDESVDAVLAKPVTIRLTNMPLRQAIHAVTDAANVRVQYHIDQVESVRAPRSVNAVHESLGSVLGSLLAGTNLHVIPVTADAITIRLYRGTNQESDGTIVGRILHAGSKQPVTGATVFLDDALKGINVKNDGEFRILAGVGEHRITVRALGFVRQVRQVTVTADKTTTVELLLEPSTNVLDEVVVTGTVVATERKAITTPITIITADEIERKGITRIEQLFRGEVPGVFAFDQGSAIYEENRFGGLGDLGAMQTAQVYARGSSTLPSGTSANLTGTNPLKTYIDGVELLDPTYLGTIDPSTIERIEIIAGPQAATVYGTGAMGGVMQIFTKKGANRSPEMRLALQFGLLQNNLSTNLASTQTHSASVTGGIGAEFSYSMNLSYNATGPWQPYLFNKQWGASVGATHTTGPFIVSGNVSITTGDNGTSSIPVLAAARHRAGDWQGNLWNGIVPVVPSQIRSEFDNQFLSFNVDHRPASFWQQHLTAGRSQTAFRLQPDAPKFGNPADTLFRVRGSNGQRTSIAYNMTLTSPAYRIVSTNLTLGMTGSPSSRLSTNGCLVASTSTGLVSCSNSSLSVIEIPTNSYGGFGSWRVGIFNALYLNLGLRGERNKNYGQEHSIDWTPTYGASYTRELGDLSLKILGSYGAATRAPNPDWRLDQYDTDPVAVPSRWLGVLANPLIRPERSRGPQGGFELYYGNVGSFTFNYYHQDIADLIQSIYVDSVLVKLFGFLDQWKQVRQHQNTATMRQRGWEITSTTNIQRFTFSGTYSWNDTRVRSVNPESRQTFTPGQVFAVIPTSVVHLAVRYAHGNTNANLSLNATGRVIRNGQDGPLGVVLLQEREYGRIKTYTRLMRQDLFMLQSGHSTAGYAKSDLSVQHRVHSGVALTLNVTNLGNSFGSEASVMSPTLGRQTRMGVTLRRP